MDARNFVKESGFKVQTENETARRARMARREDIVRKQLLRDPTPITTPPPPRPQPMCRNPLENEFSPRPAPPVIVRAAPIPPPAQPRVRTVIKYKIVRRPVITKTLTRHHGDDAIRNQLKRCFGCKWMRRYKPNLTRDMWRVKRELTNGGSAREVERRMVNHWKRIRMKRLEKIYLMKTASVRGIPYHSRNAWRDAVSNYIMNYKRTHNRRSPTKKRMRLYKKRWLKKRREELKNATSAKRRRKASTGRKKVRARR